MIIISDTTPIISFIKADRLDILEYFSQKTSRKIIISEGVYNELTENEKYLAEKNIIDSSGLFEVIAADKERARKIREEENLDLGESEAIAIALNNPESLLLIDEKKGRKVARKYNVTMAGTLGLLKLAEKEKFITKSEYETIVIKMTDSGIRLPHFFV